MKQIILLVLLSSSLIQFTYAQSTELGLMGGLSLYSGDISEEEFGLYFENFKPAFGVFGRFNFNRTLALRLGVSHGQVAESKALQPGATYNRNFRSNITEFALTAELNVARIGDSRGTQFVPYIFAGAAAFNFRPETLFDGNWIELQPLGTEGQGLPGYDQPYRMTQLAIPLGLGLKIDFDSWTLAFEFGGRKLFTDFLDNISDKKVVYRDVLEGNGELAAIISNPTVDPNGDENPTYSRGGPYKDWYYIGGMTLSFDIGGGGGGGGGGYGGRHSGRNIGCPTF